MTLTLGLVIKAEAGLAKAAIAATAAEAKKLGAETGKPGRAAGGAASGVGALGSAGNSTIPKITALADAEAAAGATALTLGQNHRIAAGQVGNLTAQFNDIGVMLAAGQNPLQLALQQGTQITQEIGPMGAAGAVKALGSAFVGMLNPVSLITIGSIAAGAAMFQWLTGAGEKVPDVADQLDELRDKIDAFDEAFKKSNLTISEMVTQFGSASPVIRNALQELAQIEKLGAYNTLKATSAALSDLVLDLAWWDERSSRSAAQDFLGLKGQSNTARDLGLAFAINLKTLRETEDPAVRLQAALDLRTQLNDVTGGFKAMNAEQKQLYHGLTQTVVEMEILGVKTKKAEEAWNGLAAKTRAYQVYGASRAQSDRATQDANDMLLALRDQTVLAETVARYGKDSAQVANLRVSAERSVQAEMVAQLNIAQSLKDELMAAWDAANPGRDAMAEKMAAMYDYYAASRTASDEAAAAAQTELAIIAQQNELRLAALVYGEDSVQVADLQAAAARVVRAEMVAQLDITESQKDALMAAWDATAQSEAATHAWAGAVASVAAEIGGILSALSQMGGGMIANASKAVEIAALKSGKSVADARMAATRSQIDAEYKARDMGAQGWLDKAANWADREIKLRGVVLDKELGDERAAAAKREAERNRSGKGGTGGVRKGGTSDIENQQKALADLIAREERELELLRETDPIRKEMLRHREALAGATDVERASVAPGTLDTLNELAAALGDDPDFAATTTAALAGKAPLANPTLTGTPTSPTAAPGTNTTQIANTAFVKAALEALVAAAPGALDTLNELAQALGDDPNFAATMTAALAGKATAAQGALAGTALQQANMDSHRAAADQHAISGVTGLTTALAGKAPLANPALTGEPTAPTAALGTKTTQLANTSFVAAADAVERAITDAKAPPTTIVTGGKLVLLEDDAGPLDSIDMMTGQREIENLTLPGGAMDVRNGRMPLMRDGVGAPLIEVNLHDHLIEAALPLVAAQTAPATNRVRPSALDDAGQMIAGYAPGEYVRLHPAHHTGLMIRGDHNHIPQLWWHEDGMHGIRQNMRQITFSQHGVTGYRWVQYPTATDDGEVILEHGDTDLIRDRRFATRRARVRVRGRNTVKSKVVFLAVIGQSNSVGAGSTNSPNNVVGPQTIRTSLPVDGGSGVAPTWPFELMTFNGGTLPHQTGVRVTEREVAIDTAQLTSLVPMFEGIGITSDRESLCTAMALHLAGPNGYDGSAFVISASFGFGSSKWQDLIYDGTTKKTCYLNALAGIEAAQTFATAKGLPLEVHFFIDQGEADASDDRAVYAARITEWLPIMQADVDAITSQLVTPQVFLAQTSWTKGSTQEPCGSALGQLDAAMANADIHIMPPGYWADMDGDTTHFKAPENQLRGAIYGEVMADWLIRGENAALHVSSATWSGATMALQMTYPVEVDSETIVGLASTLGFSHENVGGATVTVSRANPSLTDPTTIAVAFSSSPTTGTTETARIACNNAVNPLPKMGFAGGLRSGYRRANWRRFSLIDGRPLFIFANIQSIQATEV